MSGQVLVIGGSIAGVRAALDMADMGASVTILEKSPSLYGQTADSGGNHKPDLRLMPELLRAISHPKISVITNINSGKVTGKTGNFTPWPLRLSFM